MIVDGEDVTLYAIIVAGIFFSVSAVMFYVAIRQGVIWLLRIPRSVKVKGYIRIRNTDSEEVMITHMDKVRTYNGMKMEQVFFNPRTQKEVVINITQLMYRRRSVFGAYQGLRGWSTYAAHQELRGWYDEKTQTVISIWPALGTSLAFGTVGVATFIIGMMPVMALLYI